MLQLHLDLITQRQTHGISRYIPRRPFFDPRHYHVEEIHNEKTARPFIIDHHYSGTFPAAISSFGLFETSQSSPARLVGVAVFGVPMKTKSCLQATLQEGEAPCDLSRLVLTDDVLSNAETFFVSRAISLLNTTKQTPSGTPRHPVITAFSDPTPRTDIHGNVRFLGHYGCIYQASNSLYLGRATPRTLWIAPNGQSIVARSISKIVNGECGGEGAYNALIRLGAPQKTSTETHRNWINRLKDSEFLRPLRHRGNHLYVFPSTRSRRKLLSRQIITLADRPKTTDTCT